MFLDRMYSEVMSVRSVGTLIMHLQNGSRRVVVIFLTFLLMMAFCLTLNP
jgi:hypothetical protein